MCLSVCVCGVCCHHLGCVVVDSRLHTSGKSVITLANAHTHCKLVESVVPGPPSSPVSLFLLPLTRSLFLSPKLFLCDSQCGPTSGLAVGSVSCVLECVGASSQFAFTLMLHWQHTHKQAHTGAELSECIGFPDRLDPANKPITHESV